MWIGRAVGFGCMVACRQCGSNSSQFIASFPFKSRHTPIEMKHVQQSAIDQERSTQRTRRSQERSSKPWGCAPGDEQSMGQPATARSPTPSTATAPHTHSTLEAMARTLRALNPIPINSIGSGSQRARSRRDPSDRDRSVVEQVRRGRIHHRTPRSRSRRAR